MKTARLKDLAGRVVGINLGNTRPPRSPKTSEVELSPKTSEVELAPKTSEVELAPKTSEVELAPKTSEVGNMQASG